MVLNIVLPSAELRQQRRALHHHALISGKPWVTSTVLASSGCACTGWGTKRSAASLSHTCGSLALLRVSAAAGSTTPLRDCGRAMMTCTGWRWPLAMRPGLRGPGPEVQREQPIAQRARCPGTVQLLGTPIKLGGAAHWSCAARVASAVLASINTRAGSTISKTSCAAPPPGRATALLLATRPLSGARSASRAPGGHGLPARREAGELGTLHQSLCAARCLPGSPAVPGAERRAGAGCSSASWACWLADLDGVGARPHRPAPSPTRTRCPAAAGPGPPAGGVPARACTRPPALGSITTRPGKVGLAAPRRFA